jgi:hypothetical protein
VKSQDRPSATKPFPHRYEFSVPNRPENPTFSDDNSDSGEDHGSKNVDWDPTFEASFFSSEPHLLTQEDSSELFLDFNLSKKQPELLSSLLKEWNLHKILKHISFPIANMHSKNFFLKKTI